MPDSDPQGRCFAQWSASRSVPTSTAVSVRSSSQLISSRCGLPRAPELALIGPLGVQHRDLEELHAPSVDKGGDYVLRMSHRHPVALELDAGPGGLVDQFEDSNIHSLVDLDSVPSRCMLNTRSSGSLFLDFDWRP